MICAEWESVEAIIRLARAQNDGVTRFRDTIDPEVDRLFSSSPSFDGGTADLRFIPGVTARDALATPWDPRGGREAPSPTPLEPDGDEMSSDEEDTEVNRRRKKKGTMKFRQTEAEMAPLTFVKVPVERKMPEIVAEDRILIVPPAPVDPKRYSGKQGVIPPPPPESEDKLQEDAYKEAQKAGLLEDGVLDLLVDDEPERMLARLIRNKSNQSITPPPAEEELLEVAPEAPPEERSNLTIVLQEEDVQSRDSVASSTGAGQAAQLPLTIYTPNKIELNVNVPNDALVSDVIRATLLTAIQRGMKNLGVPDAADYYELRMHDENGEPEEHLSPLGNSASILGFCTEDSAEFCLCLPPGNLVPAALKDLSAGAYLNENMPALRHHRPQVTVVYRLFSSELWATVPLTDDTRAHDVIPKAISKMEIEQRHFEEGEETKGIDLTPFRLRHFGEDYVLHMKEEDRQRYRFHLTRLEADTLVKPLWRLNIRMLELRKRVFEDAPRQHLATANPGSSAKRVFGPESATSSVSINALGSNPARTAHSSGQERTDVTFLFNDVLAAVHKEWKVIKTNKFGMRQPRVIGVDADFVYNRKRDAQGNVRVGTVSNPQRPISQIDSIEYDEADPLGFRITFKANEDISTLNYKAENGHDCAEIVAKIRYLMRRHRNRSGKPNERSLT